MLLTVTQAAQRLGLHPDTVRWQIHNGKIAATKVGSVWIIEDTEADRYARENRRHR